MTRDEIIEKAKDLINGDRAKDYGDAKDNFDRIAVAWSWWLSKRLSSEITANDVALMMVLLKMARLRDNRLHEDSYYDLIGYAALAGEVELHYGLSEKMEE